MHIRQNRIAKKRVAGVYAILLLSLFIVSSDSSEQANSPASGLEKFLDQCPPPGMPLAVCFAPGTSEDYMAEWTRRLVDRAGGLDYNTGNRWSNTASGPTGGQGDGITLTYSFVPDGTPVDGETSELFERFNDLFGDEVEWQEVFSQAFQRWGALTGNTYVETVDDGSPTGQNSPGVLGVRGDIRISCIPIDGSSNTLAYNYFPNRGDMQFDASENWGSPQQNYIFLRNVCMHEHGHGLGIFHVCPQNSSKLMEPTYTAAFDGPQHDDRRAAQRHYGDSKEPNDVIEDAFDLGTITDGFRLIEVSIDDNSDTDYYRFSVAGSQALTLSLIPTGFPYLDGEQNQDGSCEAGSMINSSDDQNLNLYLYNSSGATLLAQSNNHSAGETEEIFRYVMPAGLQQYVIKIGDGAANAVQLYDIQFDLVNPAEPYMTACPLTIDTTLQNAPASITTTLINPEQGGELTISSITVSEHFTVAPTGPTMLEPGGQLEIEVTFDAQELGSETGALTINHNGPGNQIQCGVTGTAVFATLSILTPDTVQYGEIPVFTTDSSHFVALQAQGNVPIYINSVFATTPFAINFAGPVELQPGPLLRLYPRYSPTTLGNHSGILVITHTGPTSPDTVYLRGTGAPNLAIGDNGVLPLEFSLSQNYPNPFNPETTIEFALPEMTDVLISVYDINGRLVETLVDETMIPGYHKIAFRAHALPTGMYICRMEAGVFRDIRKMILVK